MSNFDLCTKINNSTFVKVKYLNSTSFIFFNQFKENAVYSLSLLNTSTELSIFEETLLYQIVNLEKKQLQSTINLLIYTLKLKIKQIFISIMFKKIKSLSILLRLSRLEKQLEVSQEQSIKQLYSKQVNYNKNFKKRLRQYREIHSVKQLFLNGINSKKKLHNLTINLPQW